MTKPPIKLNKKQISEAIQTIPLDRIVNNEVMVLLADRESMQKT